MSWMGMKASDIEVSRSFIDQYDLRITINVNRKMWEIVWADYAKDSKQNTVDDTEVNMQDALRYLAEKGFADLRPVPQNPGER